jgi:hypothetical protein
MSLPLIIALNIGIATVLVAALAVVMAGPSRMRPHHRPHRQAPAPPRARVEHARVIRNRGVISPEAGN